MFFRHLLDPDVQCFEEAAGIQEELYSNKIPSGSPFVLPGLLNFYNPLVGPSLGVTALVRLSKGFHPKTIKFVAEAFINHTVNPIIENKMIRLFSETYQVIYDAADKAIGVSPSSGDDAFLDLGYSYEISDYTKCVPPKPFPFPELPAFEEFMCACFLGPRRPKLVMPAGQSNTVLHNRILNDTQIVEPWNVTIVAPEIFDFFGNTTPNNFAIEYDTVGNLLVIIFPFMPTYKEREWTQREVVIEAIADNGLPLGKWISPWLDGEKDVFHETCVRAFAAKNLRYTKPPFPAVGKCHPDNNNISTPRYSTSRSCYFHFHSQSFFVDCIQHCVEPKYICAVWQYEEVKTVPLPNVAFDFQFVAHSIYYKNAPTPETTGLPAPGSSPYDCPSSSSKFREWYLLETHHQNNKAFSQRSSIWRYSNNPSAFFKEIGPSSEDADSIMHRDYQMLVTGPPPPPEDQCVTPATYYLETKDNNLCLCTFWGENLETWQIHYGRGLSCVFDKNKPGIPNSGNFIHHFKIELFPQKMTVDTVIVRVYANPSQILLDYFILHAIYIQALDQFGVPVGKFERGHWKNIGVVRPGVCAEDRYPPEIDPVVRRHPVFGIDQCPKHPAIPELGITESQETAELWTYKNLWRDGERYSEVCAKFHFPPATKANFPHVTQIQFVAFLRIEDITNGRQAYMTELRSNILQSNDFSNHPVTAIVIDPPPLGTDVVNLRVPLNYRYFQNLLQPTTYGYERSQCITPGKEPPRRFDLCRHYITTVPINEDSNKDDLDKTQDEFYHNCRLWTALVYRYGENHVNAMRISAKLPGLKARADVAKLWKSCFTLKAYKHPIVNSYHVAFRVLDTTNFCKTNFSKEFIKEVAIVALNEEGYPIGRKWARDQGSFKWYIHYYSASKNSPEFCNSEDIALSLDEKIFENKMVHDDIRSKCIYDQSTQYALDPKKFHQDYTGDSDLPSMLIWANFGLSRKGFCAHWYFPNITTADVVPPSNVQFIASVHVLGGTGDGGKSGSRLFGTDHVITIRSPKYNFEYNKKYFYGTTDCHLEEAQINNAGKPNDDCGCTIDIIKNPTGFPQLCDLLYENFNHILDNKIYRSCLTVEDQDRGNDDFAPDDCRTKIEYPMPPLVFKPEQIELTVSVDENFTIANSIGLKDPTNDVFQACGLIKQCYSRYSNDQVDKDCIKQRSCDILVTFGKGLGEGPTKDEAIIEIFAIARGWAAIGISPDDEMMSEDYVMECVKEGAQVHLYNSWNILAGQGMPKPDKTNYRLRGDNGAGHNIRVVKSLFYHEKLYCKFYIKKKFTKTDPDLKIDHEYDLDKKYFHILAFSDELPDRFGEPEGNIKTHLPSTVSEQGRKIAVIGERLSPVPSQTKLIRLHGVFMTLSWLFFITLSSFIARYFKETFVKLKIMNLVVWYFFHVLTMSLGFLCLVIGIVLEIRATSGWKSVYRSNFHTYSGIISICLYATEIIIGLWVKRGVHADDRKLLSVLHTVFGHLSYNIALVNMAFSGRVAYGFLACNFSIYIWAWLGIYYLLHMFMSYHYCWVDFILGRTGSSYGTTQVITQRRYNVSLKDSATHRASLRKSRKIATLEAFRKETEEENEDEIEAPGKYIRLCALGMFVVITSVYTFWTLRKLLTYPRHCYNFYELKALEKGAFT